MRRSAIFFSALAFLAQARAEGGLYDYLFEPGGVRLDEVIGLEVVTPEGKTVGRIRDVLFDRATGKVESIALDRNGSTYPVSALLSTCERARSGSANEAQFLVLSPELADALPFLGEPARLLIGIQLVPRRPPHGGKSIRGEQQREWDH